MSMFWRFVLVSPNEFIWYKGATSTIYTLVFYLNIISGIDTKDTEKSWIFFLNTNVKSFHRDAEI